MKKVVEDVKIKKKKKSNYQKNNSKKKRNYIRKKEQLKLEKKRNRKIIIIILSSFLLLNIITIYLYFSYIYKEIKIINFTKNESILVNNDYIDKDISICYGTIFDCKKVEVTKEGEVDTTKLGEYSIFYKYNIEGKEEHLERVVTVYDDIKPEIIIDEELSFCKNGKVGKGKYHATDNYDGDITDKVELSIEGDKSYLSVVDSSNNKESIEVNVLEFSSDPVITLNGKSNLTIYLGSKYNEEGAVATDICDGDLTDKIIVNGSVNTNQIGTYTITYSVENSDLKKAEVKRTISVVKRVYVPSASGSNGGRPGVIYLTFDDGPQSGSTEKILNILKEEGIKATFFVTNNGPDYLIQREFNEGHVVALHTASHNYGKIYSSVDAYFNDLYSVQSRVKRLTGYESKIIRFPGGSSNTVSRKYSKGIMTTLTSEVLARGFRYHDWNVDSGDAGACSGGSSSCVYNHVVGGLSKSRSNMVLMHDIKYFTANALRDIITYGKNNGYSFDVITMDTPLVTQRVNN